MSEIPGFQPEQFALSPETEPQNLGQIVVITGRSGAGKDMVKQALEQDEELNLENIVTYTNRPPRTNEVDGVDYHFISPEEFAKKESEGFFAEVAPTGDSMKGTPKAPFDAVFKGQNVEWRVDISRAATLEEFFIKNFGEQKGAQLFQRSVVIYVDVKDHQLLQERYRLRDPDKYDDEEYNRRYQQETNLLLKYGDRFQNVILNDGSAEETIMQAKQIIMNSYQN